MAETVIETKGVGRGCRRLKGGMQAISSSLWVAVAIASGCWILAAACSRGYASSSDAKSQIIAALESNLSKIEDVSLEYTATTTNKGAKEPMSIEHYDWALKGDDQRLSYRDSNGWHHVEVRSETKLLSAHEKYGAPREISIEDSEPGQLLDLSYMRANISGFLFNDLTPSSFLEMLQSTKATFDIVGNTGIVEMADVPGRPFRTTFQVDLDKGLVLSRKITVEGRGFAEFVAKDLTNENGIWFMKTGVLHTYGHKRRKDGTPYSENTVDVLVEIRDLHFNAGLSDSLFAVVPQLGDNATLKMGRIWVDYFATDEQKRARVVKETEGREAIARLQGKPAPALHIRKWVNRKPETTGKKQVYLFWSKNCGPSMGRLQSYDRQYRVLSTYVEVIGIHRSQDAEGLEQLIEESKIAIPIGVDEDGKTHAGYHVDGWPSSFLVNEDGTFSADMQGSLFIGNFMSVPSELGEQYLQACSGR